MTLLAVALLTIVAVSYHHRRVTPILPPAIGRNRFDAPAIACRKSQPTSAKHRQRPNPHSA
jgi:hypothetical protein